MKIILLKDVAKLGRRGEIKETSDGYARNFLILRNLAAPATPENIKRTEEELKSKKIQKEHEYEGFHALQAVLAKPRLPDGQGRIVIKKKAYKNGRLYAAVSREEIIEALKQLNFHIPQNIEPKMIRFDPPIKTIGAYEARIMGPKGLPAGKAGESITIKIEVEKE
ncbi:MAG: 50S ribosomal protein L9 [Candidatus Giovannonibacteria bacterium GW2011_GWC2_44_9]|uniref:Large ribosomal subunit protein bL9 n=3 Tax=Candidatus Giovannoniibacteriota TaxID=1752738 RepID=A0A0G1L453_9BACT|nr:MAG: 50S ribosomal protein L9 [Candidatus Giovannonibacteria bacterium GW2011_GWB1_44_23]KKT63357.1 MAG: 50S ribosomal protein L9 [Candidatus Giovannonibacteria bacterium GW2011_GWA1_44_29]KKT83673.1 MAG: 50S ribosomal protein L9 [Candidatus Giovannonibacteria bacterium GW2011_GWC2_44_9]KKT91561.1 MAG: 50S ribosomal protein L9 [Parcubacteria group bacterium GW2011_GWC1_45_13]